MTPSAVAATTSNGDGKPMQTKPTILSISHQKKINKTYVNNSTLFNLVNHSLNVVIHTQLQGSQAHHIRCHKQHEPLNKLLKASWSHSTLTPILGSVALRPVGSPNCGNYQLGLLRKPYLPQVSNQIKTSQESSILVTLEVMELLSKEQ